MKTKDAIILIAIAVAALIACAIVFWYGGLWKDTSKAVSGASATAAVAVPFSEIAQGDHSSVTQRVDYLITSSSELDELWSMTNASGTPPVINFATSSVIAVFAGDKPTDGYSIDVSNVADAAERTVSVMIRVPNPACAGAQAATAPYQIISLPKTTLPLTHTDTIATTTCP